MVPADGRGGEQAQPDGSRQPSTGMHRTTPSFKIPSSAYRASCPFAHQAGICSTLAAHILQEPFPSCPHQSESRPTPGMQSPTQPCRGMLSDRQHSPSKGYQPPTHTINRTHGPFIHTPTPHHLLLLKNTSPLSRGSLSPTSRLSPKH